jgi:hypothetical protein
MNHLLRHCPGAIQSSARTRVKRGYGLRIPVHLDSLIPHPNHVLVVLAGGGTRQVMKLQSPTRVVTCRRRRAHPDLPGQGAAPVPQAALRLHARLNQEVRWGFEESLAALGLLAALRGRQAQEAAHALASLLPVTQRFLPVSKVLVRGRAAHAPSFHFQISLSEWERKSRGESSSKALGAGPATHPAAQRSPAH